MKSLLTILALSLLASTLVHAEVPANETLKEIVTEKFYRDANDQKSGLAQALNELLGHSLKRSDYEVITLSSQSMRNPWAYAYGSDDKKTCTAGDSSSEFLIVLRVKLKNPAANSYATYTFKVAAEQSLNAVHRDGIEIDNCSDVSEDNGLYVIAPAKNLVGGYEYVEIAAPKSDPSQEAH